MKAIVQYHINNPLMRCMRSPVYNVHVYQHTKTNFCRVCMWNKLFARSPMAKGHRALVELGMLVYILNCCGYKILVNTLQKVAIIPFQSIGILNPFRRH